MNRQYTSLMMIVQLENRSNFSDSACPQKLLEAAPSWRSLSALFSSESPVYCWRLGIWIIKSIQVLHSVILNSVLLLETLLAFCIQATGLIFFFLEQQHTAITDIMTIRTTALPTPISMQTQVGCPPHLPAGNLYRYCIYIKFVCKCYIPVLYTNMIPMQKMNVAMGS